MREGQHVKAGDELFEIDPRAVPHRASTRRKAKLASVRTDFANLKSDYQRLQPARRRRARRTPSSRSATSSARRRWSPSRAGSQVDYETAVSAQLTAQLQAQLAVQRKDQAFNQLLGNPDLPIEKFPAHAGHGGARTGAARPRPHRAARADRRHRDAGRQHPARPLRHRRHAGVRRDRRQRALGRRQSEGNRHHLSARSASRSTVVRRYVPRPRRSPAPSTSVSPGTGAQFAILPPQNASGNWVKVVQRVPVRIRLDKDPMTGASCAPA